MLKSRPEDALVKLVKLVKLWRMMAVSWSFVFWWYPLMCSAQWALLIWKRSILYAVALSIICSQCPAHLSEAPSGKLTISHPASLITPIFYALHNRNKEVQFWFAHFLSRDFELFLVVIWTVSTKKISFVWAPLQACLYLSLFGHFHFVDTGWK